MSRQTASRPVGKRRAASSYNDLIEPELFERLENFLKRLEIYTVLYDDSILFTDDGAHFQNNGRTTSVLALATKNVRRAVGRMTRELTFRTRSLPSPTLASSRSAAPLYTIPPSHSVYGYLRFRYRFHYPWIS
jgi:hypothetical protein